MGIASFTGILWEVDMATRAVLLVALSADELTIGG
jgi:hypothetical protein